MRKYTLFFRCPSSFARCVAACCLGILLLVPASLYARSRHTHRSYRIRRGDTLSSIASRFGVTASELRRRNHLRSNRIVAGRSLEVPAAASADSSATRSYRVRRGDTLSEIASRFGVTASELRRRNHLRSNRIVAGHTLEVPETAYADSSDTRSYRIRRGDTLISIASRFGMTASELRRRNHLRSNRIVAGHTLEVSETASADSSDTRSYRIRRGDTLISIASRFGMTASELRRRNHLRSNRIVAGRSLEVPLPVRHTQSAKASGPSDGPAQQTSATLKTAALHTTLRARGAILRHTPIPRSMPEAPRGTHEVLVHQNVIADVEGLQRIQNRTQLKRMIHADKLVPVPLSSDLVPDRHLAKWRRYCRPWTAKFLVDLSRAYDKRFGEPLRITSAVRTVTFQRRLEHYNANAAPTSGNTASPHLTGEAIDIGKKGMSRHEIAWMRKALSKLQAAGKLDVEEEFHQACFHISVYKTYVPRRHAPARLVASETSPSSADEPKAAAETADVSRRTRSHKVRHAHSRKARRALAAKRRHRRSASLLAAGIR